MRALPAALEPFSAYRQFMLYKLVPRADEPGKTDKFPVDPHSGEVVSAHESRHWVDAELALATAAVWGAPYGVAFVFTSADPFWFLDVDNCLIDGDWTDTAKMLLSRFAGAAVEVSQSGRGLHLFGRGQAPANRRKKGPGFDLYTEGRFVALTGDRAMGSADTDHTAALTQLCAGYLQPQAGQAGAGWTTEPRADWRGPTEDADLLDKAMGSRSAAAAFGGKATFADLYTGDADVLARCYPSDQGNGYDASRADAALAQHLAFWTGADCERIERLMRGSALVRDKWDSRPDYLEHTIELAASMQREVYAAPEVVSAQAVAPAAEVPTGFERDFTQVTPVEGNPFLTPSNQIDLFAGCVYILDKNAVMTPHGMLDQGRFRVFYGGWNFSMDPRNERTVRNPWEAFTESQAIRFPRANSTCFRPELEPGAIVWDSVGAGIRKSRVNTYRPIETLRIKGDPGPFLRMLAKLLPDERDRRILLTYLAACVQHKGLKFQWWPVLQGVQGNGKTLLISAMRHAIGEQYCFAPNVSDIAKSGNKFNGWIEDRLFIALEEVYVADRRSFLEDFKTSITNDWLPVERKGVDQVMGDNRANGIMATNHRDGVPVDTDQRRYCVFFTAQQHLADLERDGMSGDYFPDLYDWAKGRNAYAGQGTDYGYAVIHEYLATYPLDTEFNPAGKCQRAPSTSTSRDAIRESLGGVEQQILEAIEQGRQGFAGGWVSSYMLDKLLDELRASRAIPQHRRRELMRTLGYEWHPGLPGGRVNNPVAPDNSKPRLYVQPGSAPALLVGGSEIGRAYTAAQATSG